MGVKEPNIFQTPSDQNKVYQNAIRCVDLDPERLAVGAYLDLAVTKSAVKALFQAVADVCLKCNDLALSFEVAYIDITDKQLKYSFGPEIAAKVQSEEFERGVAIFYPDPGE